MPDSCDGQPPKFECFLSGVRLPEESPIQDWKEYIASDGIYLMPHHIAMYHGPVRRCMRFSGEKRTERAHWESVRISAYIATSNNILGNDWAHVVKRFPDSTAGANLTSTYAEDTKGAGPMPHEGYIESEKGFFISVSDIFDEPEKYHPEGISVRIGYDTSEDLICALTQKEIQGHHCGLGLIRIISDLEEGNIGYTSRIGSDYPSDPRVVQNVMRWIKFRERCLELSPDDSWVAEMNDPMLSAVFALLDSGRVRIGDGKTYDFYGKRITFKEIQTDLETLFSLGIYMDEAQLDWQSPLLHIMKNEEPLNQIFSFPEHIIEAFGGWDIPKPYVIHMSF